VIEATVSAVTSDCDMLRLLTRDLADIERSLMDRTPEALLHNPPCWPVVER
jgi:hypothetical protein